MNSDSSLGTGGGSDESKDVGQHNKEEIKKETSKLEVESDRSEEIKEETGNEFDRYKRFVELASRRLSGVNGDETYESENLKKKISSMSYDELFIRLDDYTLPFEERHMAIKVFQEKYTEFSDDPEGDECSIGEICGGSGCQGCCGPSEDEEEEVESKKKKIKIEKE